MALQTDSDNKCATLDYKMHVFRQYWHGCHLRALARLFARIHITMIKGTEKALNVLLPKYNIWLPSRLFHETGIYELEILDSILVSMGSSDFLCDLDSVAGSRDD